MTAPRTNCRVASSGEHDISPIDPSYCTLCGHTKKAPRTKKPIRYFIGSDNSGHHYVVRADCRKEWEAWLCLDEDDEASWNVPGYARRINGSECRVTFESPEADYVD